MNILTISILKHPYRRITSGWFHKSQQSKISINYQSLFFRTYHRRMQAKYGSWKSPVQPVANNAKSISDVQVLQSKHWVVWLESRPQENGRGVVMYKDLSASSEPKELSPPDTSVRSRVHEYGGRAFAISPNYFIFSNDHDSRLYLYHLKTDHCHPISPADPKLRYGDLIIDSNEEYLYCVMEQHPDYDEISKIKNSLIRFNLKESFSIETLVDKHDFVAHPRFHPFKPLLTFITWDHPNMNWDRSDIHIFNLKTKEDTIVEADNVASKLQPTFLSNGSLIYLSDENGFWNFHTWENNQGSKLLMEKPIPKDFCEPLWVLGDAHYVLFNQPNDTLGCVYLEQHQHKLAILNVYSKTLTPVDLDLLEISHVSHIVLESGNHAIVFLGASCYESPTIYCYDLKTMKASPIIQNDTPYDPKYLSHPEFLSFLSDDGSTTHMNFYSPQNRDYVGEDGELPPLLVISHGGPTSRARLCLQTKIAYFTSRGFAVADVNYGGSSGYGRRYRNRLKLNWGIVDVDDCYHAVQHLIKEGLVDPKRVIISGSSAGGLTVLNAISKYPDTFSLASIQYGVTNLEDLVKVTHKFEAFYPFSLIAPYPEGKEVYEQRSPSNQLHKIRTPCIFFQGLQDKVVPPSQSEQIVEYLRSKNISVDYITYENEGHGFRSSEAITKTFETQLSIFSKLMGFDLPAEN